MLLAVHWFSLSWLGISTGATLFLNADRLKHGMKHSCPVQLAILLLTLFQPWMGSGDCPVEVPWVDELLSSATPVLRLIKGSGLLGTGWCWEARLGVCVYVQVENVETNGRHTGTSTTSLPGLLGLLRLLLLTRKGEGRLTGTHCVRPWEDMQGPTT